jgi:glycosyltransferase involved in cell wall biosynthesis
LRGNNIKIAAIIPFYNEAGKIDKVVFKTLKFVDLVICVDDGSDDDYLTPIFNDKKVILLRHNKNYGKGRAINTGVNEAIKKSLDCVICLDGDLQHDPEYIPKFIDQYENFDIVIGQRDFNHRNMPLPRRLSNFFSSKILSILTGKKILDSQSGYRLIKLNLFNNIVIKSNGFEAETELLLKAAFNGFRIGFTKIPTLYSVNDDSKIKNLNSIYGFFKVIVISFYEKYKKKKESKIN